MKKSETPLLPRKLSAAEKKTAEPCEKTQQLAKKNKTWKAKYHTQDPFIVRRQTSSIINALQSKQP